MEDNDAVELLKIWRLENRKKSGNSAIDEKIRIFEDVFDDEEDEEDEEADLKFFDRLKFGFQKMIRKAGDGIKEVGKEIKSAGKDLIEIRNAWKRACYINFTL